MEEHTRKHTPLTRKIKRVFVRRKGNPINCTLKSISNSIG